MEKNKKHHIKIGDKVKVITGNQKGFIGLITSFLPKKECVFIEGIIPRIRTLRKSENSEEREKKIPVSIHISNVMLWDTEKNESSRIGYKIVNGKKQRYFKKSNNLV
jgi:large subunit ribosomal protein L24